MTTKYKYHDPEGTYFMSNAVVNWIENDDLPGCSRAQVENTCPIRGNGGNTLFHAHGKKGTPTGYTSDLRTYYLPERASQRFIDK